MLHTFLKNVMKKIKIIFRHNLVSMNQTYITLYVAALVILVHCHA